jgi:hypothetical protein
MVELSDLPEIRGEAAGAYRFESPGLCNSGKLANRCEALSSGWSAKQGISSQDAAMPRDSYGCLPLNSRSFASHHRKYASI